MMDGTGAWPTGVLFTLRRGRLGRSKSLLVSKEAAAATGDSTNEYLWLFCFYDLLPGPSFLFLSWWVVCCIRKGILKTVLACQPALSSLQRWRVSQPVLPCTTASSHSCGGSCLLWCSLLFSEALFPFPKSSVFETIGLVERSPSVVGILNGRLTMLDRQHGIDRYIHRYLMQMRIRTTTQTRATVPTKTEHVSKHAPLSLSLVWTAHALDPVSSLARHVL